MRARSLGALVAAAALVMPACSDDDDRDDGGPSTPPSSTSTTAASTTSTTRPSVERAVVLSEHGILGSWEDGHWVPAGPDVASPFAAGQAYTLVSLDGPSTTAIGVGPGEEVEFCNGIPQVELEPAFPRPTTFRDLMPIAVHGVPSPQPRSATSLDPDAAVYREAAAAVLADLGVDDPEPDVVQVVRADLSGDGTDEVLVVAEQIAHPEALGGEPGDYSVLFLRQLVDDRLRTTVVAEHQVDQPNAGPYILSHRVSSLADLNGDGALEVVVHTHYYEGSGTHVYELAPSGTLEEALSGGCGL